MERNYGALSWKELNSEKAKKKDEGGVKPYYFIIYLSIWVHSLSEVILYNEIMSFSKDHSIYDKTPSTRFVKNLLLSSIGGRIWTIQKQYKLLLLPLVASQNLKVYSYCRTRYMIFEFRMWSHEAESGPEASYLSTSFRSTERCHGNCQERETILPCCDTCEPQQWPAWQDMIKGAVAAPVSW